MGLAAAFLSASVLVLWSPWATLSEGEVERAKSEALASGNPAFYLGDEVNGYPLNDYYLGPDQANFFYGECHDDPSTAGDPDPPPCIWDVEVYTWWTAVTIGGDAIAGCVRQAPVAGVPTAHLHDLPPDPHRLPQGPPRRRHPMRAPVNAGASQVSGRSIGGRRRYRRG